MTRSEFAEAIRINKHVFHDGIEYIPIAYILHIVKNKWQHSVWLKDLKANSFVMADLNKVNIDEMEGRNG